MTSRERVGNAIHFRGVDRIPHWLSDGGEDDLCWLWIPPEPDLQPWTTGSDGKERRTDSWGVTWARPVGAKYFGEKERVPISDIALQAEYVIPDQNKPEHFEAARLVIAENNASANPKYCLGVMPFTCLNEGVHNLTGLDQMFLAYYEAPLHLKALVARLAELQRESIRRLHSIGCDGVMGFDDWGLQDSLMIGMEMIEEFFKPHYVENWRLAHELGMDVWLHSCGYLLPLLPKFREWGLDVIQPCQQENMGLENIDRSVGGKLAFWCPVDIQKTMVYGSEEDIRNYVKRMKATIGNHNGGLVSMRYPDPESVGHTPEKVAAMCAAFRELGR